MIQITDDAFWGSGGWHHITFSPSLCILCKHLPSSLYHFHSTSDQAPKLISLSQANWHLIGNLAPFFVQLLPYHDDCWQLFFFTCPNSAIISWKTHRFKQKSITAIFTLSSIPKVREFSRAKTLVNLVLQLLIMWRFENLILQRCFFTVDLDPWDPIAFQTWHRALVKWDLSRYN